MSNPPVQIELFDFRSASHEVYSALNAFVNCIRSETHPDDPPISDAEAMQNWRSVPAFMEMLRWVVWSVDRTVIIASGGAIMMRAESNQPVLEFTLEVLPAFRRQGLGSRLLTPLVELARREKRSLLTTRTTARIPAGSAFMQRLGAKKGLESHINQLNLAELDRRLLEQWQIRATERAPGFELTFWADPCPNAYLEAVTELVNAGINQQPHGQLTVNESKYTPERVREAERSVAAAGNEHWTICAREQASGQFVGLTDVFWNPNRPQIVQQGLTIVLPAYRKRGLGRWLKAAMVDKILREYPQVSAIRTRNADSNAAMLQINHELGFKPYLSSCVWQVETEQVASYLQRKVVL